MSDASMREVDERTNVREEIILLRRNDSTVHVMSWSATVARRVARSTCTAELLAAADTVDKLTYLNHVLKELSIDQPTKLETDSRVTFHLFSALRDPAEAENKMILSSIRDEHSKHSMETVRWTPGESHLADALIKRNPVIAKILNEILAHGYHTPPDASYVVVTICPGTLQVVSTTFTDIEEALTLAANKNCLDNASRSDHRPAAHCSET